MISSKHGDQYGSLVVAGALCQHVYHISPLSFCTGISPYGHNFSCHAAAIATSLSLITCILSATIIMESM